MPELSKVKKWSASNCRRNEVNMAFSAKGTIQDKKTQLLLLHTNQSNKLADLDCAFALD